MPPTINCSNLRFSSSRLYLLILLSFLDARIRENIKRSCYPHHSLTARDHVPLGLCIAALFLTGYASWDCHYFFGANISFLGGNYGLWTVEDGYVQIFNYYVVCCLASSTIDGPLWLIPKRDIAHRAPPLLTHSVLTRICIL